MGVPYEIQPQSGIDVSNVPVVEAIEWPHRSRITKIVVTQIDGVAEAFTVALYNHPQVSDGSQTSDSVGPDVGPIPDDHYRVTPDLVAVAGKLIYFSETETGGAGFQFFSQKAKDNRQGQRDGKLYVKITPVGAGVKKFCITIGGEKEVE